MFRTILANDRAWGYANQLVRETLPSGAQKQWKYAHNVLQESIDANGCSRRFEHEAHNLIVTDEQGPEWLYQYNADRLLAHLTASDGSITRIEYNTDKLPCQIHLPGRPELADVELTRLALMAKAASVLADAAEPALRWLDKTFRYRDAAAWGR